MRLFIAITFNTETITRLVSLRDKLRATASKGHFTLPENIHLTLVFLGECDEKQVSYAKSAMDALEFESFKINIDSIGKFRRDGGDLWWAGVKNNRQLTELYNVLTKNLSDFGFKIERRKFKTHITLGREIITKVSPHKIEEFGQMIDKIKLMKSERINNKLIYTAIHECKASTNRD